MSHLSTEIWFTCMEGGCFVCKWHAVPCSTSCMRFALNTVPVQSALDSKKDMSIQPMTGNLRIRHSGFRTEMWRSLMYKGSNLGLCGTRRKDLGVNISTSRRLPLCLSLEDFFLWADPPSRQNRDQGKGTDLESLGQLRRREWKHFCQLFQLRHHLDSVVVSHSVDVPPQALQVAFNHLHLVPLDKSDLICQAHGSQQLCCLTVRLRRRPSPSASWLRSPPARIASDGDILSRLQKKFFKGRRLQYDLMRFSGCVLRLKNKEGEG